MNLIHSLLGIQSAMAETVGTTADMTGVEQAGGIVSMIVSLLPMILIFVVFYFFMIRPQKKKDKAVKDMLAALKKGDRVCTIGGIYGTIDSIKDDTITLSVGKDHVQLVFARWAIRSVEEVSIENDAEALN
jgi:preprotein translocase subunit YajC